MEITYVSKNEHGVSLIEVLAVLVIAVIVMTLSISFLVSSNKQNHAQQDEARQIYDSAYILKLITKDIRRADEVIISPSPTGEFTTISLKSAGVDTIHYTYSNAGQLQRGSTVISNKMEHFNIVKNANTIQIEFVIKGEKSSTTIALRTGGAL